MSAASQPRRRLGWIAFGLGMIALRVVMGWAPGFAEDLYGRGVFPLIRLALDNTLGRLPFPAVYLVLGLLVLWGIRSWRHRRRGARSLPQRLGSAALGVLAVVFALAGLFLVLWGFNYARIPLRHQLELPLDPLAGPVLMGELERAGAELTRSARFAPRQPGVDLEQRVRAAVAGTLEALDWPAMGRPRVRTIRPGELLMVFGVSGIYNPFTGAATLPAGLPAVTRPFLAAHEIAHAWGITDEGEANLTAFLACTRSADPELIYSAHLAWWGYLAGPASRADSAACARIAAALPQRVSDDLTAIRDHWRRFRGRLMRAGQRMNQIYLRSQGVAEGVVSYDAFPALVRAWRRRETEKRPASGKGGPPGRNRAGRVAESGN